MLLVGTGAGACLLACGGGAGGCGDGGGDCELGINGGTIGGWGG